MRIATVHQPAYLPYVGTLAKIDASDIFVLYDNADFLRRDFVHRNRIMTRNGVIWLTIPVHGHQKMPIREVKVDGSAWKAKHLASIRHAYGKSLYFDRYFPSLELALAIRSDWLIDYDISTMLWLFKSTGVNPVIRMASGLGDMAGLSAGAKLAFLTAQCGADSYLAGPAWKRYLKDTSEFASRGIRFLEAQINCSEYAAFCGYAPNMSAIDLLFSSVQPLFKIKQSISVK